MPQKAKVSFQISPTTKSVLLRLLAVAEDSEVVRVLREPDGRPAFVFYGDRKCKPLEFWQAFRRVALGMTPAPSVTAMRAKDVMESGNARHLTATDCVYILKESL